MVSVVPTARKTVKSLVKSFRIQYASNLNVHKLQYWEAQALLNPSAPNLALIGDIGLPDHKRTKDFLRFCEEKFERIYWVPGAVELGSTESKQVPWNIQLDKCYETLKDAMLQKTTVGMKYTVDDKDLLLCFTTLWSKEMAKKTPLYINPLQGQSNRMNSDFASILYHDEANWLATQVFKARSPTLCFTYSNSEAYYKKYTNCFNDSKLLTHIEGATIDGSSRTYTGGSNPWFGINMVGHKGYSPSQVLEIKLPVPELQ